eukprot:3520143-Rhodomonas_salina.1
MEMDAIASLVRQAQLPMGSDVEARARWIEVLFVVIRRRCCSHDCHLTATVNKVGLGEILTSCPASDRSHQICRTFSQVLKRAENRHHDQSAESQHYRGSEEEGTPSTVTASGCENVKRNIRRQIDFAQNALVTTSPTQDNRDKTPSTVYALNSRAVGLYTNGDFNQVVEREEGIERSEERIQACNRKDR